MTTDRDRRIQTRPNDNTEGHDGTLLAGVGSDGQPHGLEAEERVTSQQGYGGLILATHEQILELMRSGFGTIAAGRADADGSIPVADQAADATAQRILVDEHGRIWVRLSNAVINPVSERWAIVGEDTKAAPLDKFTVGTRTAKPIVLYNVAIAAGDVSDPASMSFTDPIWLERGSAVTIWVKYTADALAVGGGLPHLYPQHSNGQQEAGASEFDFIPAFQPPAAAGVFAFASAALPNLGPLDFPCFPARIAAGATATTFVLNSYKADGSRFVRFGVIDENTHPGVLLVVATVN